MKNRTKNTGTNWNTTSHGWRQIAAGVAFGGLSVGAAAGAGRPAADARDTGATAGFDRAARIQQLVADATHDGHDHDAGGACVSLPGYSIMFEPGATTDEVQRTLDLVPNEDLAYFVAQGSRWTQTATDGAVAQGAPFTITYSFVPDGTPVFLSTTGDTVNSNLFATLDAGFPGGRAAWKARVRAMFDRYSELTNITYVEVSDDGAGFPLAPGGLGARGDVRIAMRPIGDGPLAVNFFPQFGGDMVMDSLDLGTFANAVNDFVAFRNILSHEHAHGLGLNHVIPQNGTKLMEPALNTGFDGPQEDDIRGVQFVYGDAHEANDAGGSETFIGGPLNQVSAAGVQVLSVEDVALERDGASDFYGFTAFAGAPIAIRVEPVGSVYQSGPQSGGVTTTIDASATRNLGLRLWRRVSAQTGQLVMLAQINFNAAGEAEYHPPIPYNQAGYMLAEVYSTDGLNDVQRYTLTISNTAITAPVEPGNLRVFHGPAEMDDSHTVLFGAAAVGQTRNETIQIANDGAGVLELGPPTLAGPAAGDFSFTLLQNEVQPGDFVSMAIAFSPSALGQRVAVISLPNNDPDRADFSFIVSGTGLGSPQLEVRIDGAIFGPGTTFAFGDVTLGDAATASVVLRNVGTATLNVSSVSLLGADADEYAIDVANASLAVGAETTAELSAAPTLAGLRSAQLRFISNGVPTGFSINLSANGVEPIVDCNANGVDDATDIANGTSTDCDTNGVPDECEADADGDGVIDACDQFPGQDDNLDSDGDGLVDALDGCPNDPNKTEEGVCGCGVADEDDDQDGVLNCEDAFPNDPNNGVDPNANNNGNADNGNDNGNNQNDNGIEDNDNGVDNANDNGGFDNDNGQDVEDDDQQQQDQVDDDDFDGDFDDEDNGADFLPNPCGFGLLPGLMVSALSLGASRGSARRKR